MPSAYGEEKTITVISRNLYLGADVGVAMELIPDFSAAAQFMWDQVKATNFKERAPKLAQEVISHNADVVGLQEATFWYCKKSIFSKRVVVYDFTEEFLKATKALGTEYVLAEKDGVKALNIGYSIPAIPLLTMVNDPETFQPIFGSDKAACGFEIGDALAVKRELAGSILTVGNTEYEASYSIIPKVMTIYRGYTWADIDYKGSRLRVVTTHLESLWDKGKIPNAAIQAKQLIGDLSKTSMPLIVMGDFNSDPRDPRPDAVSNPGGQPEASGECLAQVDNPTIESAIKNCNAYWLMREAGFQEAGPNTFDPKNFTWGMNALLTGPDKVRLNAAKKMGNQYGFTDRLDYVFLKNGAKAISSSLIGNTPTTNGLWASDHAGTVVKVFIPASRKESPALPEHAPFPISFWNWVGITLIASIVIWKLRRRRKG